MPDVFDLFGDPVPSNWGQPGRPQHVASQQNRNRVSMLVAAGWSNVRIAAAMYITVPTLRKHYFSELKFREVARDRLNANMLTKLWELFMGGSVAAAKEFRDVMRENDRMTFEATMGKEDPVPATRSSKVGKKVEDEQRAVDADEALNAELDAEAHGAAAVH